MKQNASYLWSAANSLIPPPHAGRSAVHVPCGGKYVEAPPTHTTEHFSGGNRGSAATVGPRSSSGSVVAACSCTRTVCCGQVTVRTKQYACSDFPRTSHSVVFRQRMGRPRMLSPPCYFAMLSQSHSGERERERENSLHICFICTAYTYTQLQGIWLLTSTTSFRTSLPLAFQTLKQVTALAYESLIYRRKKRDRINKNTK
jgi:hypothetical protein